ASPAKIPGAIKKANECIAKQESHRDGFTAAIDFTEASEAKFSGISCPDKEEETFYFARLRRRFMRADVSMHIALADELDLGFLRSAIESAHTRADLCYFGLINP